jgi:Fur family transcriptional regulator, ferric uptake regulator
MSIYTAGIEALRNAGYKLTRPRLTILEVLAQQGGHLTSTELVDRVAQADSSIGRASVFRALELMTRLGILCSSAQGRSTIHHMLMPGGHHHHLVCTQCHKLVEFDDCCLGTLIASLEKTYGIQIEGHLLELFGLCETCRTAQMNDDNASMRRRPGKKQ